MDNASGSLRQLHWMIALHYYGSSCEQSGGWGIFINPSLSLCWHSIASVDVKQRKLRLNCPGLQGAHSPLPSYWQQLGLFSTPGANYFNQICALVQQRMYALLYPWLAQSYFFRRGGLSFEVEQYWQRGLKSWGGQHRLWLDLRQLLPGMEIVVDEYQPSTVSVKSAALGQHCELAHRAHLGERALVAYQSIHCRIQCTTSVQWQRIMQQQRQVLFLLRHQPWSQMTIQLLIQANFEQVLCEAPKLGQVKSILGRGIFFGEKIIIKLRLK